MLQILQIRILFYVIDNRRIPHYTPCTPRHTTHCTGGPAAGVASGVDGRGRWFVVFAWSRAFGKLLASDRIGSRFILRRETPRVSEAEPSSHLDHRTRIRGVPPTSAARTSAARWRIRKGRTSGTTRRAGNIASTGSIAHVRPPLSSRTHPTGSPEDANMSMHML